jgi:hypothetical protein
MPVGVRHTHFTVDYVGRRWAGDWRQEGRLVCVSSAYGSRSVDPGRRTPEAVARRLLKDLVDEWRDRPK